MATPLVEFYVLPSSDPAARLRFACRLVEKAYLRKHRVRVQFDPGGELAAFDEMLWTFRDRSFVPHERLGAAPAAPAEVAAPVVLADVAEAGVEDGDVLVNLAAAPPQAYQRFARVAEVVDADDARRQLGRERFRFYRDHGIEPGMHHIREQT